MNAMNGLEDGIDFGDPTLNDTEAGIMEGFDDGTPTDDAGQAQPDAEAPTEAAPQGDEQPDAGGSAQPAPAEGGQAQPAQQQQPAPTGQPHGRLQSDKDGNLIDAAGKVVATAGRERRIFEQNDRLKKHSHNLETQVSQLRAEAEKINQIAGMPAQHGLGASEVEMGMKIMADFKNNPLSVAQWALKETLAMGYNLKNIIGEGEAGIEMQAIARMIDQKVDPVVQQTQQRTQQDTAQQAARQQYDAFMAKHEHAGQHEDALTVMLQKDPSLTPETAYWRLSAYAAQNGYDFSQPLGPQINARRQQQAAPQPAPQPVQPTPAPMPQGAAPSAMASNQQMFASPDAEWDDIIGDSMRNAGMR